MQRSIELAVMTDEGLDELSVRFRRLAELARESGAPDHVVGSWFDRLEEIAAEIELRATLYGDLPF